MPNVVTPQLISDINLVSEFLSHPQVHSLLACEKVDVLVICASAVLHAATTLFSVLEQRPDLAQTVLLCGGIGHSTSLMYDAVARHAKYHEIKDDVVGLPEARVLEMISERFFDLAALKKHDVKLLVEEKSTNCGANASESRKVLEKAGVQSPKTFIVLQDPTMLRRTMASFQKVYSDVTSPPKFLGCPVLVPKVKLGNEKLGYDLTDEVVKDDELWEMERFLDLLIGEIPRLRDDKEGYGPIGKGFITSVDVCEEVQQAWERLKDATGRSR
ncbi:hypothetical protein BJ875DRAFT_286143 [Amylocarpus encephaloides]|uniref:DUF218 domain-containing protein n=1 Tax=Amylocarpus encephaloides TaxID=45428 RepID=A0A9P8C9W5_9HELO|nr:hypothetical protein BJ875DRAFT_286143 [Amylocarpus encephaloides]